MSKIFPNHLISNQFLGDCWASGNVESTLTFNPHSCAEMAGSHIPLYKSSPAATGSFPERCVVEKSLVLWRQSPAKCGNFFTLWPLNLSEHSHYWNRADVSFWALTCCENGRVSKLNSTIAMVLRGLQF